jgi:hypothetical protein
MAKWFIKHLEGGREREMKEKVEHNKNNNKLKNENANGMRRELL